AGVVLPALDRDVDVAGVDLDTTCAASGTFGGNHRRSGPQKGIENDAVAPRAVFDGVGYEARRLDGWMQCQFFKPSSPHRANAWGFPHIRAVAAMLAQFKVVDVPCRAGFPDENQLVAAAVEVTHAGIGLGPNAEILQ